MDAKSLAKYEARANILKAMAHPTRLFIVDELSKHATKHYHETGHPTIRSFEPGETWMYCYEDEVFMQPG